MHDTVSLEGLGIPAVFLASDVFEDGAVQQSQALGADPRAVYIPHPIQDRTDAEMVVLAEEAFESILSALLHK